MIIATSISSVSAVNLTVEFKGVNVSTTNFTPADTKIVNGTIVDFNNILAPNPAVGYNGTLYLAWFNTTNWVQIDNQTIGNISTFQFNLSMNKLPTLGQNKIGVIYQNAHVQGCYTAGNRAPVYGSPQGVMTALSPFGVIEGVVSDPISVIVKSNTTIVWDNVADLKVGQEANLTGKLYGYNETNLTQVIGLKNVFIWFLDADNKTIGNATTDENGSFTFANFLVSALSFKITAKTDIANNTTTTLANASANYNETTAFKVFNAVKGVIDGWLVFDSPVGYLVNNASATVGWVLQGAGNLTGKNILAWIVLYSADNPNVELRKIMVNLNSPAVVNGVNVTGHVNLTKFIRTHDKLWARLVINGVDLNTLSQFYETTYIENDTFVYDSGALPVAVTYDKAQFNNLKVGENKQLVFNVIERTTNAGVASGFLKITWDGQHEFMVPVIGGVAIFDHTFSKANNTRLLQLQYVANPDLGLSQSAVAKEIVNVAKGTAGLTLTQMPSVNTFVGEQINLLTLMNGFAGAAASAPKFITLNFVSGGVLVHSVNVTITPDADLLSGAFATTAKADFPYAYIKDHAPVLVSAFLEGGANYNNATSNVLSVVVVA